MTKSHFVRSHRHELQNYKYFYQITKTTSLEDFSRQQQLKWISITRSENGGINMMTFHTNLNKRIGRKLSSITERLIAYNRREKANFQRERFYNFYRLGNGNDNIDVIDVREDVSINVRSMEINCFLYGNGYSPKYHCLYSNE